MSTTQGTPALGLPAFTDTRPARSWHGRPIPELADFDPDKSYVHVLTADSPCMDAAILDGLPIRGLCARTWVPKATDYCSRGGGGPRMAVCPVCAAIWTARGGSQ